MFVRIEKQPKAHKTQATFLNYKYTLNNNCKPNYSVYFYILFLQKLQIETF